MRDLFDGALDLHSHMTALFSTFFPPILGVKFQAAHNFAARKPLLFLA
jgi:hypothetical protein